MGSSRRGGGARGGKDKDKQHKQKNAGRGKVRDKEGAPERPAPPVPRMGPGARIVGMVLNPADTLDEVIRAPRALGAVAILLAANLLLGLLLWERIHEHFLWRAEYAPPANVPAEDLLLWVEGQTGGAVSATLIGPAITWLMIALLLRILGTIRGQMVTFGLLFNIAIFGMVPHMLGLYLDSVLRLFLDPQRLDFMVASLSLAYLVPGSTETAAFPLLNAVQPFTIWGLVLVSLGAAKVLDRRLPQVLVPVLGVWFLLAALQMFTYRGPGL